MSDKLDISPITDQLFIGAWPKAENIDALVERGVKLILWMQMEQPDAALGRPPMTLLQLGAWDTPVTFVTVERLRQGVDLALPVLAAGGKVMACCKAGRRRSAAMAASILIAQGATTDEAIAVIKDRRPVAKPDNWWVQRRLRQFEQRWTEAAEKTADA
jgi:protein-tyrosine phosphatase